MGAYAVEINTFLNGVHCLPRTPQICGFLCRNMKFLPDFYVCPSCQDLILVDYVDVHDIKQVQVSIAGVGHEACSGIFHLVGSRFATFGKYQNESNATIYLKGDMWYLGITDDIDEYIYST